MLGSRTQWLVVALVAGQPLAFAAEPDCYYGEGKYTFGTMLCQAGMVMQCQRDEEGRSIWTSLDRQCSDRTPASALQTKPNDDPENNEGRPISTEDEQEPAFAASESSAVRESVPTAAASGSERKATIDILYADYGRGGQTCDARSAIVDRCAGEAECGIVVGPDVLCGDPLPGRSKLLSVYWACKDGSTSLLQPTLYAQDESRIEMNCGAERTPRARR